MPRILCVNSGSSSLKVALFAISDSAEARVAEANVKDIHGDYAKALDEALEKKGFTKPDIIGHRVVHGGPEHRAPTKVDDALVNDLERLTALAPLHLPPAIAGIRASQKRYPDVPQVACFDTAFHATIPEVARRLPIPLFEGIQRYGFHGLSYEYVVSTFAALPSRVVIAHLGNGASVVAVKDGKAIDTTMGLTPTGGVLMGTRTGDVDPGVLVWLLREKKMSVDELEDFVNHASGLKAIGGASDMQQLLARSDHDAKLAVDMFVYAVKKAIGSYIAALGGLDLLVFTGGIGENATNVREKICEGLEAFGKFPVKVVPTDEDLMIARHARVLLADPD